jgi:hypothetical protein
MPCSAGCHATMQGVLRLQFCFASRRKIFAQDDTARKGSLTRRAIGGGDPDALGGGAAQGNVSGGGGKSECLIVVAFEETQLRAGSNAAGFEKLEQAAVALVDTADRIGRAGGSIGKKKQAAMAATGGTFHLAQVAVRADSSFAEFGQQLGFEVRRDGVFETLGFVVNLPPLHAEKLGQHAFDEMVAEGEFAGNFAASGGEAQMSVGLDAHQAVFFQTAHRHGDSGR